MTEQREGATTVTQLLAQRVEASPNAPAFRHQDSDGHWETVSWLQFGDRVARLRRALFAAGLRRGDRFALIAPVSLEWELLHHAALSMGATVLGLDAHDLPERISEMARQADIRAFAITDPRCLGKLDPDGLAEARFVLLLGDSKPVAPAAARFLNWSEFELLGTESDPPPPLADDTATIIFTSGTTGAPKGIAYTHRQLCLAVTAVCEAFEFIGPGGRMLCWLPLSNLFQRVVNLAGIRNGPVTYLLGDPRRVMEVAAQASPDVFIGVPRFYEKLYDGIRARIGSLAPFQRRVVEFAWSLGRRASRYRLAGQRPPAWLELARVAADRLVLVRVRSVMGGRLRCMVTGSAPASKQLLEEFHALGWLVLEAYGLSENVLPMAMNRIDAFRFGTVGRPLAGNEIRVDEAGAISVRGPGLFAGYLRDEAGIRFDADGFYSTGDLGQFDAEGYLRLTGRSSEMIKTSTGRRVAPAGVESRLRQVPGIEQVLVLGNGRKHLVALCTFAVGFLNQVNRGALAIALKAQAELIAEHERPLAVGLIDRPFTIELGELTPNLKLRRQAIEANFERLISQLYDAVANQGASGASGLVVL